MGGTGPGIDDPHHHTLPIQALSPGRIGADRREPPGILTGRVARGCAGRDGDRPDLGVLGDDGRHLVPLGQRPNALRGGDHQQTVDDGEPPVRLDPAARPQLLEDGPQLGLAGLDDVP